MQDQISKQSPAEIPLTPKDTSKRPTGVTVVSWILIALSVLGLLSIFLAALSPGYNALLAGNRLPVPLQKLLAFFGLLIVFLSALFMRDGAAWSRWLFAGYSIFGILVIVVNMGFSLQILPGLLLFALFAVVLFGKSSSAFFRSGHGDGKHGMVPPKEMGLKRACALAAFCLVLGLAAGYSLWGGAGTAKTAQAQDPSISGSGASQPPLPALAQETFENAVRPLLAALDKDPNDFKTIVKLANLYDDERKYPEAKQYYERALKIHPEDPDIRTDLGTVYYRLGDADRAIAEYLTTLQYQPGHVNALYNLGIVKWKAKQDSSGAIAAWEELLQRNPSLPERQQIEQLISMARSGKQ